MRAPMTALAIMAIASFSAVSAFMGPAPVGLHALGRAGTSAVSLRHGRSTTLGLKMQESRGICPICGTDVFTNQARELDENGMYVHSACVEAKLSAEGQTRISEQELAELKAMAAGLPPPPPKKRAAPKPAGAPFGGLFGGLFGGGGGGASSGPEMPDLPQATSVPSQAPPQGGPPPPPPAYGNQYAAPPPPTGAPPPPPPQAYGAPPPPPPQAYGAPPPPPQYAPQYAAPPPPEPKTSPVPAGQRVVPQAGVSFPGYFVEGVDYFFSSKNEFQPGEMCGILRSDGNIKFGVIIGVNPRLDINGNPTGPPTYDVQVEKNGSYYQGKFADSLYKIVPDVMRVGIVLQQQAERGWF